MARRGLIVDVEKCILRRTSRLEFISGMIYIRKTRDEDFASILDIINDAAQAYGGVIPADRWREPYMPASELRREIVDDVVFWGAEQDGRMLGVMGIQDRGDVALVRHAYVLQAARRRGIGTGLLKHVRNLSALPMLVGTWAAAAWAIAFYQRNGFTLVANDQKEILLRRYWSIPDRQVETSVVLADSRWLDAQALHR
jgi:N-acetylglutamate synthase-like GNAT family acetyltransferase